MPVVPPVTTAELTPTDAMTVLLPENVLQKVFLQANKQKGPIPICGTLNGHPYIQTLVKYAGHWRLYLNTPMLKATNLDVGDTAKFTIEFDPTDRTIPMHPKLAVALDANKKAKTVFDALPPSRQKEIVRYISALKNEETVDRNVDRAIQFLFGNTRFIGSDKP